MSFTTLFDEPREPIQALTGHNILTITDGGGGGPLVTTALAHGLSGAANITLSGTTGYDGSYTGTLGGNDYTVISPTTFSLNSVIYSSDSTGGRWD